MAEHQRIASGQYKVTKQRPALEMHLLPKTVGSVDQTYLYGGNYVISEREAMFKEDFTQMISKTSSLNPDKVLSLDIPLQSEQLMPSAS